MAKKKKYWYEIYVSPIVAGERWTGNVVKKSRIKKHK
jgi:hypothetical protein